MTASGMNERDERKSTFGEASKVFLTTSKPEVCFYSGKSVAETLYGALVVKSDFHSFPSLFFLLQFFCSAPGREPFFRPGRSSEGPARAAAVKVGPSSAHRVQRRAASLTAASTTAGCVGLGRHTSHCWFTNRVPPVGRSIAEPDLV